MILFFAPGGRLGNLLFQYAFLETLRKSGERIFSTQLKNLPRVLTSMHRVYNSNSKILIRCVDWIIDPICFHILAKPRLIGTVFENNGVLQSRPGLLPVHYVKGYFQKESFVSKALPKLTLRPNLIHKAYDFLREHAGDRIPVFIHVRRGDYLSWSVADIHDPSLPGSYYREGLQRIAKAASRPLHVFLIGDDPDWCAETFKDLPNATVTREKAAIDLALLSLCAGGVVSNSTFGWWGAALCGKTLPLIAPLYWLGWKNSSWYPRGVETSWLTYIDVTKAQQ